MKQEQKEIVVKKESKNNFLKNILLVLALIILVIMLFLPPALRRFVKERDNTPKTTISVLNCTKNDEIIITAYSDNKPYNFYYSIKGNHTILNIPKNDEMEDIEDVEDEAEDELDLIADIISYSSVTYNETEDKTEFNMPITEKEISILEKYTGNIDNQDDFYTQYGYICERTILN